jgi:hypothetical protein
MVVPVGPLATINCEPRQTRKGAAAAMDSGAGVWRAGAATIPARIWRQSTGPGLSSYAWIPSFLHPIAVL